MKKTLLTLSIVFFGFSAFSQIHVFPIPPSQPVPCKTDSSVSVLGFTDWCVYQTTDSTMFGPIDSTCFDAGVGYQTIDFGNVNLNLPLYLRYKFDSTNQVLLDSNQIFSLSARPSGSTFPLYSPLVDTSANCKDGLCSAVFIALETPNATGSGTVTTWYSGGYVNPTYFPTFGNLFMVCFSSQNITNETLVKEVIFRMEPTPAVVGTWMSLPEMTIEQPYFQSTFTEILAPFNSFTQRYEYGIFNGHELGLYHEPTFPSMANLSYLDVSPTPNSSSIETVFVEIGWQASIHFQPYTQLRGGLVMGSTVDRHLIDLTINGGNVCLDNFFELIFWGNDRFTYKAGEVSFYGEFGCLFFGNGAKMIIENNATFNYGRTQQGLLALLPGGTIEIGKNATLNISNTVRLNGHPDLPGEPQVYMTLNHGSKLQFLKGAHVENVSTNPKMKLNIYMEGGEVDLSGLPNNELKYINLIYRNPFEDEDKNLQIIQNPVVDNLNLEYICSTESRVRVEVYDISGAKVISTKLDVQQGINYLSIPVNELSKGAYVLSLKNKRVSQSKKLIKL